MAGTGQTINDRINAVRYALVGQGLARTVCKATTEEVIGPKKKHLDYLLVCTQEPNVSVPQLANLLIERSQHISWTVVFKGLITIHHLIAFGNERFTQYLATSNHSFSLPDFMDRSTPQGYSMSTFVRRYSKYVNDKCISYRNLAIDICKLGTGNDNPLRTMNMEKLSKTLPIVHEQYDSLLEFEADAKDLNNGIIMAAFRLLYKDLVRLYIAYQEAIINLLERYFKLSRKKTREALELYKQYLSRMDKVAAFFKVADAVGLDKSEIPDLTKSPASILNLLEQHLAQLEAKKKGANPSATSPTEPQANTDDDDATTTTTTSKLEQMKLTAAASKEELREGQQAGSSGQDGDLQPKAIASDDAKSQPTSPKASPGKPAPPKPPARPSPSNVKPTSVTSTPATTTIASSSKQAAAPTKTTPTTTQPKSTNAPPASGATSAGPPERPTKPPSRPPPPSAPAAPSAGPSTSSTPVKKSNAPPAHPPAPAEKKPTTPTPPAPPHPPPPTHMPTHSGSDQTAADPPPAKTPSPEPKVSSSIAVEQVAAAVDVAAAVADEQQFDEQPDEEEADNHARDELRAPIDANNLDRPDSGVGSPSNGSETSAQAHPGPTCSASANEQVEQQQVANDDQAEQIPNHSGNYNSDQVNGHDSRDQEEGSGAAASEAQVAAERHPSPPPPPPPAFEMDDIEQPQQEADVNHVNNYNNNNNSNQAHNGQ